MTQTPAAPARTLDTRNLAIRDATAAVFSVGFLALLYWGDALASKLIFAVLLAAAVAVGARELVLMGVRMGLQPSLPAAVLVGWGFLLHFLLGSGLVGTHEWLPLWMVLAAGFFIIHFGALLFAKDPISQALPSQAVTWMAAIMLGLGLGFQLKLFLFTQTTLTHTGSRLILALYLTVWLGDSAAYFAGSFLGKHKFAPKVSPKKTWEGAAGNLLGNLGGAALAKATVCVQWTWIDVVLIGCLVGIAGMLGDLVESTWKRSAGVKDSAMGIEIPGHGGILDRMDSLFFAAPVLWAYVHFVHGLN